MEHWHEGSLWRLGDRPERCEVPCAGGMLTLPLLSRGLPCSPLCLLGALELQGLRGVVVTGGGDEAPACRGRSTAQGTSPGDNSSVLALGTGSELCWRGAVVLWGGTRARGPSALRAGRRTAQLQR